MSTLINKYLEFKKEYYRLNSFLHGFNPEDEDWFFPELQKLINKYGAEIACEVAKNDISAVYTTELFVKAGFRSVDKDLLLEYSRGDNEDDVYGAALCLAICGYSEGFELLEEFADMTHRLSKNIHPIADILPDLRFVDDARADILETSIKKKYNRK